MGNSRRMIGLVVLCAGMLVPAAVAAASPQYVALGDSYSSGVGTRTFYEESGECDRSPDAFGPKIATRPAIPSIAERKLRSLSCSASWARMIAVTSVAVPR